MNLNQKTCSGCNECCKGWLIGNAFESKFSPFNPCKYLQNSSCSIYSERPDICKGFNCEWIINSDMPESLKPSTVNTIVIPKFFHNQKYLVFLPSTEILLTTTLMKWANEQYQSGKSFIVLYNNGHRLIRGPDSFVDYASRKYPKYYNLLLYQRS